ncbi:DUF4112 domain-containing protein [Oculatella sp. LEGE 06141]|uniref:DUF4112 domain-containing protein n=1 Tax=Oculatella sp. LEGE 06141 TaxID=1828648 RepID=UPI00187F2BE2|nr:DUF4112 domain-containing protein [Oculatella sp. LEGE 06141]MBE9177683.1 DUF4112 domain-containing protein [Oculatella sp. LEGE 06141]
MQKPSHDPLVVHPHTARVARLRRLSHVLDKAIAIPGTGVRFGLDPVLGLIPGGGDTIAGVLSAYIIVESARMGLPRQVIGQMVSNVLLDSVFGTVPVVGDLFDVGWKANVRNIALLERHLDITSTHRANPLFLALLILALATIVLGFAAFAVLVIRALWNAIAGV